MNDKFQKSAPWLALAVVMGIMGSAGIHEAQVTNRSADARFKLGTEQVEETIHSRLQNDADVLRSADEFIAAQQVDAELWRRYVNSLHLDEKYPTFYGLGYAVYVSEEEREPRMKIVPRGQRFDYFVVQQIEPRSRNEELMNFDLGTDVSARAAAERARDSKSAALTGKLILADDPGHHDFLLFYPVFRDDNLQGWVFGRFRDEDLLKGLERNAAVLAQIYDGPAMTHDALFYDSGQALSDWQKPNEGPTTIIKGFTALGQTWTLNFTPALKPHVPIPGANGQIPPFVALCLVALTAIGCWVLMRRHAGSLANSMMADVWQRETALTSGPFGLVVADTTREDWPVTYVNRAFEKITGYSNLEAVGKNCRFLQGTDRDQKGLTELRKALREQRACRVLLRNYRKDGSPFWNDLQVTPVRNDMGRIVQMTAVLQDVTEREQTSRRLATESAIIRALAESPSLFEAAPRILEAICQTQEWDLGSFWSMDPRTQILQCVDQWHALDLQLPNFENFIREATFTRDIGVPGYVWAKGEPIWLPELSKESRFPEASFAAESGLVSACGFPIANKRGLQGVLVFYSRRIWPLSKNLLLLMVGTGAQISQYMEREQVETEQKELTILERGLAEFMGEGLIAMDRDGYCLYVNVTAGRMLGFHPRTLVGQNLHDVLHPASGAAACNPAECPIHLSLQSTKPVHVDNLVAFFQRQDRTLLPVAYTTSPIIDQGLIQGVVITFVDVSARRAEEMQLRETLKQKEEEIQRIQNILPPTRQEPIQANPSDELLEKIRKLLG